MTTTDNEQGMTNTVPRNQFRFEIHGHMTSDGYEQSTDYKCNYCGKLCYYGETFGHSCKAYDRYLALAPSNQQVGKQEVL